ncbi:MAG TPA: hypothetical protein VFZ66_09130 [Herpetosiphonaceae bacterium]
MFARLRIRPVLVHLVGMAIVIAAFIAIEASPASAKLTLDSGLLVSTRDRLRVCVTTSPALAGATAAVTTKLATALQAARQHKDWAAAGLGSAVPRPEMGCPGAQIPSTFVRRSNPQAVGPGLSSAPSPFRTAIIVLDAAKAERVLGERKAALVPFEMMRADNDELAEVTSALVVREDFIGSPDFLDPYLTVALGLEPTRRFERPAGEQGSK